ncbi:hypothetical protein SAY87_012679 [Trapa incisa]|uniref:Uncharacterized protein n=2 Tax=Trapa TaxID=22665 RepID=A0AAN7LVJ6_TRANT|nr:hypothetical protein SAY87_012679 [Trapa incisa]KAK4786877.1 hypothetical protein SAY86_010710 [Trapa natans]
MVPFMEVNEESLKNGPNQQTPSLLLGLDCSPPSWMEGSGQMAPSCHKVILVFPIHLAAVWNLNLQIVDGLCCTTDSNINDHCTIISTGRTLAQKFSYVWLVGGVHTQLLCAK